MIFWHDGTLNRLGIYQGAVVSKITYSIKKVHFALLGKRGLGGYTECRPSFILELYIQKNENIYFYT